MPIEINELIRACQIIAEEDGLDVCITESLKGAAVTGIAAFICGIVMGPVGLAIGGAAGGLAGSAMAKQYRPLGQILMEMSDADKRRLYNHMVGVVNQLEITDAILLMAIVSNPTHSARDQIAREIITYFRAIVTPPNANRIG